MSAVVDNTAKRWTYEEYSRLEDEQRYEIIQGNLLMAPAPDTWHQNWLNSLNLVITPFVRRNRLGQVFLAPVHVVLDEENTVQPDLVYVAAGNRKIVERRAIFGVPDLLVELVSPSSVPRDCYEKKELYARFGVQEYWIGDPANRSLEILTLRNGEYQLLCAADESGPLTSLVISGLAFDLAEVEYPPASALTARSVRRRITSRADGNRVSVAT